MSVSFQIYYWPQLFNHLKLALTVTVWYSLTRDLYAGTEEPLSTIGSLYVAATSL